MMKLKSYQKEAIERMHNGCILCGGVGAGKSITGLAYYYILNGGTVSDENGGKFSKIKNKQPLYIITTAKKRDTREWEFDMAHFQLSSSGDSQVKVTVDSWNNITKYIDVKGAFFIFDEQRVVGWGTWSKSFVQIAKNNQWILMTATPGDTWLDYAPVFIANGFYKNITEFRNEHVIWDPYTKFRKVNRYIGLQRLIRLRNKVLINMDYHTKTESHHNYVLCRYDQSIYKIVLKNRIHLDGTPLENAAQLCYELRKVCNTDVSRMAAVLKIFDESIGRVIIFYNYDYELEILKGLKYGSDTVVAEWNGHKHEDIPNTERWVYLVQYNAGAEGWNCVRTDTIIFYSATYSYKTLVQAAGRIDRMNTPFRDLYYYHLRSNSSIDLAIHTALKKKKKFNENKFIGG